jgi:polyphosphate kinase
MHRNLDRRVESLVRIDRDQHKRELQHIIDFGMSDEVVSWHLAGSEWTRVSVNSKNEKLADFQEAMIRYHQRDK